MKKYLIHIIITYPISDTLAKNLSTWRTTVGKVDITNDGSSISYQGEESVMLTTAQRVPLSLCNFSFEIEITSHVGRRAQLGIGISTESEQACYSSRGDILDMSAYCKEIDRGDAFETNDVISVHLSTINIDPPRHQLVFMKNNKKAGKRILDVTGKQIRLLLWIGHWRFGGGKQNITISSSLGTATHSYNFGTYR